MSRALGHGGHQRDASRGGNDAGQAGRGSFKGRGKGKSGKREGSNRSAVGIKDTEATSAPLEMQMQQMRPKPRWCLAHLRGSCQKSDLCPYPHLDEQAVARIKSAERRHKETAQGSKERDPSGGRGKTEERGRSPSRDKKGKKWRTKSVWAPNEAMCLYAAEDRETESQTIKVVAVVRQMPLSLTPPPPPDRSKSFGTKVFHRGHE